MKFPYPVDHDIPVILAPMAGVSESPFRRICREWGADVVVTEFLSNLGFQTNEGLRQGVELAVQMWLNEDSRQAALSDPAQRLPQLQKLFPHLLKTVRSGAGK